MISKPTRSQEIPQVHPRDFCVAFGGITLFIVLREAYGLYTGRFPEAPSMLLDPFLGAVWLAFLCGRVRGGDALSIPYGLALAGYTLLVGDHLFSLPDAVAPYRQSIGLALTGISLLAAYVAIIPRRKHRN